MTSAVGSPPALLEGLEAIGSELLQEWSGLVPLPRSAVSFFALPRDSALLVELRLRLSELGYALPPDKAGAHALGCVLLRFQREAALPQTGWLEQHSWDALHQYVALDGELDVDGWERPAARRAALFRLQRLGRHPGPSVGAPPSLHETERAVESFSQDCLAWGWLDPDASREQAWSLLFHHQLLQSMMPAGLAPVSFDEDPEQQELMEKLEEAQRATSGWATEPELEAQALAELGDELEGPFAFGLDEDEDDEEAGRNTLRALEVMAERHGERLQEALDEVKRLGRDGGLWDGIRAAFRWLSRWVRKVGQGLNDLVRVGRPALRQAARILHAVGGRALSMLRDALRSFASLGGGVISGGKRSRVRRRLGGDIEVVVIDGIQQAEIEAACGDLRTWSRAHTRACKVLGIVVSTVIQLLSGPVGWAALLVKIVTALWKADLLDIGGVIGGRLQGAIA